MKYCIIYILTISLSLGTCLGQVDFKKYELFKKLGVAEDLKWGIPSEIMIDSTLGLFVIAYDYNPTYLDFYDFNNWKNISRVEIKGYTSFDSSYFNPSDSCLYVDRGRNKNKYIKIELTDYSTSKIDCQITPKGCDYGNIIVSKIHYDEKTQLTIRDKEWYVLKYDDSMTEIYIAK
jgi:hypothetical protein